MRIQVLVRLKPGVLDVQGKAVAQGLKNLGDCEVGDVRIGRLIELEVAGENFDQIKHTVSELCEKVLANPVIEQYEIRKAV